jgi:hypothetical protein
MDLISLGLGPMVGCCEYCSELLGFIKGWKFFHQQSEYHLLKTDPAPKVGLSLIHANIKINRLLK